MATQSLNMPYLLVAGAMVLAVVFGFAIISPAVDGIFETQAAIESSIADLAEKEAFLRTLDSKVAELEINREHESRLATVLPEEERMEDALRILHRAAESSGLQIQQINNNSGAVQSQVKAQQSRGESGALPESVVPLSLNVTYTATYQNFRSFLTTIERTPRLMDVSSFLLQQNQEDPTVLNGKMAIDFYFVTVEDNF